MIHARRGHVRLRCLHRTHVAAPRATRDRAWRAQPFEGHRRGRLARNAHAGADIHEWVARVRRVPAAQRRRHASPQRAASEPIAVIDVGSTSFKVLIARLDSAGKVQPIYEEKRQVKLLSGADFATIEPDAVQRAHDAMQHFGALAARYGVELHAIATAGLRDATNSSELIASIRAKYGIAIQVISARSEAAFVFNGAMLSAVAPLDPAVCIDMGGGSTEVCVGHGGQPTAIACIGLGSSKLAHSMPSLLATGVAARGEMLACMRAVREHLAAVNVSAVREELARLGMRGHPIASYGTSGTIKCIAKAIAGLLHGGAARDGPLTPFSRAELAEFLRAMEGSSRDERLRLNGVKKKRADLVIPGAILLLEVMHLLGMERMAASETGLREGIVATYLTPVAALRSGTSDGHLPVSANTQSPGALWAAARPVAPASPLPR